jgi:hypothetical protein
MIKNDPMVNNVTGERSECGWFLRLRQSYTAILNFSLAPKQNIGKETISHVIFVFKCQWLEK